MSGQFSTGAVVIGAGVVGLAIARALALAGRDVTILEKNAGFGKETSARNSEVIHAGIYYPTNSLKARLCVEGRHLLYAFCESRKIGHKKIGKLIVATHDGQDAQLDRLLHQARDNGVDDLKQLSRADIAALEPELSARGGPVFALHRHHRQPSIYAGAAGRGAIGRRRPGAQRGSHRHRQRLRWIQARRCATRAKR